MIVVLAALALVVAYFALLRTGALGTLSSKDELRALMADLGGWGPAAVIALEAAAVVLSPIPSGPVAFAAGAAFGPALGALYIVIGAEAGALIAFGLARWLGYDAVRRWAGGERIVRWLEKDRSQAWLMAVVFGSRLMPFISFDAVSYAAGLTPLSFWRFAVATLLGVVPIAFLFTALGEEVIESQNPLLMIALVGGITALPVLLYEIWAWRKGRRRPRAG